jgi:hypothetical protein
VQKLFRIPVDVWLALAACVGMLLAGLADFRSIMVGIYLMVSAYVLMTAFSRA